MTVTNTEEKPLFFVDYHIVSNEIQICVDGTLVKRIPFVDGKPLTAVIEAEITQAGEDWAFLAELLEIPGDLEWDEKEVLSWKDEDGREYIA